MQGSLEKVHTLNAQQFDDQTLVFKGIRGRRPLLWTSVEANFRHDY